MRSTWVIGAVLMASTGAARGGGLVVTGGSPRAIGRAGTGTVGDDGGGALLVNPAAMARRDDARGQVGLGFSDDEIAFALSDTAPIARNQSPSSLAPHASAVAAVGPWVIGLGAMTSAVSSRSLDRPRDGTPPEELGERFEFRYAGISGSIRRDTITAGVARRIGDTLAVGLSIAGSRVAVTETRRMWAGFSGRDKLGSAEEDIEVSLDGVDGFVPSAVAGILLAPEDAPLELGASIAWTQSLSLAGGAGGTGTARGPTLTGAGPSSRLSLRQPWTARAGARYLSDRFVVELGGDLWLAPAAAASAAWSVTGMTVTDPSGVTADLTRVPSRISMHTHGALRTAVEVELAAGFLWATAGYAFTTNGVTGSRQSPTFGDLGGHTLALGLEATAGGFTFTAGWSRTWSVASRPFSALSLDNPFPGGDATVPTGTYDGSIDQLGILIDAQLFAPR